MTPEKQIKALTERAERAEQLISQIASQNTLLLKLEPTQEQVSLIRKFMRYESDSTARKVWNAVREAIQKTNPV